MLDAPDAAQMVSISELLKLQPNTLPSVIGYNTVPGYHHLSRLPTGELLNRTDSFANATASSALQLTVLYGGGNTAKVLPGLWFRRTSMLQHCKQSCSSMLCCSPVTTGLQPCVMRLSKHGQHFSYPRSLPCSQHIVGVVKADGWHQPEQE